MSTGTCIKTTPSAAVPSERVKITLITNAALARSARGKPKGKVNHFSRRSKDTERAIGPAQ